MPKGELPLRYLEVPLRTKKISIGQCQPLIEKMLARITSWTTKFLSYADRLQLLKAVVFLIQIYWSQLLILPKNLLEVIERM